MILKTFKSSLFLIMMVLAILTITACGGKSTTEQNSEQAQAQSEQKEETTSAEKQTFTFLTPKGAPALPGLLLAEEGFENYQLELQTWDQLEQLLAHLQNQEGDFIAAPVNVASTLVNKGLPLKLINVNTWGTIFLVTTDDNVKTLADLEGESLYISHKSGPPDVLTKYLLEKEGIQDKVELNYATPPEIAQMLIAGKIKHAVLPEPVLSSVRIKLQAQVKEVIDFQAAWKEMYNLDLPQAGIVVTEKFAKEHPEVIEAFQKAYGEAIEKMYANPDEIAKLAEQYLDLKGPIVKNALNKMVIKLVEAKDAKASVEQYFLILLESQPESIGGQLPNEGFYYK